MSDESWYSQKAATVEARSHIYKSLEALDRIIATSTDCTDTQGRLSNSLKAAAADADTIIRHLIRDEIQSRVADTLEELNNQTNKLVEYATALTVTQASNSDRTESTTEDGAPQKFTTGVGQVMSTHQPGECATKYCVIHNPSDHRMRDYPTLWREDRGLMERICPHGVGHPDPDHLAAVRELCGKEQAEIGGIHGCDGCCGGAYARDDGNE